MECLDEAQAQALHVAFGDNSDYDGLEFIWPGLDLEMVGLVDHLPGNSIVFTNDIKACRSEIDNIFDTAQERFKTIIDIPVAPPEKIYETGNCEGCVQ